MQLEVRTRLGLDEERQHVECDVAAEAVGEPVTQYGLDLGVVLRCDPVGQSQVEAELIEDVRIAPGVQQVALSFGEPFRPTPSTLGRLQGARNSSRPATTWSASARSGFAVTPGVSA
ncbi:hypothetical protein GCM10027613_36700 [Microlunatus endophyticus]